MLKGFRDFVLRGNVIDLAVAVVIGAAFTSVVNSVVEHLFNPVIGALFNADSLATAMPITIPTVSGGSAVIGVGAIIAAAINFLIVAIVVYFVFVAPLNAAKNRMESLRKKTADQEPAAPSELELLAEIRDLLAAKAPKD